MLDRHKAFRGPLVLSRRCVEPHREKAPASSRLSAPVKQPSGIDRLGKTQGLGLIDLRRTNGAP